MDNVRRINRDFSYHAPDKTAIDKMSAIRLEAKNLALLIDEAVPDGREKALAITNLEQVSMWANAGIARSLADLVEEDRNLQVPTTDFTVPGVTPFKNADEALKAIQKVVRGHDAPEVTCSLPKKACGRDGGCGNCKC